MIRLLGQAGFEIEVLDTGKWDRMPVPRAKLAAAFFEPRRRGLDDRICRPGCRPAANLHLVTIDPAAAETDRKRVAAIITSNAYSLANFRGPSSRKSSRMAGESSRSHRISTKKRVSG